MDKINWKQKLTSRKLWVAVAGFISGMVTTIVGDENLAVQISGLILQFGSVIGYLLAEGLVDANRDN